jgi:hypothetical protein
MAGAFFTRRLGPEKEKAIRHDYFYPPYLCDADICIKYGISRKTLRFLTGGSTPERDKALKERRAALKVQPSTT